jgi:hypothetical protein
MLIYKERSLRTLESSLLVLLIVGIKESAVLNNIFTFVNLSVIVLVIAVGITKIRGHNWHISPSEVPFVFAVRAEITRFPSLIRYGISPMRQNRWAKADFFHLASKERSREQPRVSMHLWALI